MAEEGRRTFSFNENNVLSTMVQAFGRKAFANKAFWWPTLASCPPRHQKCLKKFASFPLLNRSHRFEFYNLTRINKVERSVIFNQLFISVMKNACVNNDEQEMG